MGEEELEEAGEKKELRKVSRRVGAVVVDLGAEGHLPKVT